MSHLHEIQQSNIAIVRQLYYSFLAHDIDGIVPLLADNVDWLFFGPATIPFAGHYIGPLRVAEFFHRAIEKSEFVLFEPRDFVAGINTVLVQGHERGIARSTGKHWETEWAHVYTIEDGRITKLREYYDTAVVATAFME
jgi:ketosteroid isomerase-like protein